MKSLVPVFLFAAFWSAAATSDELKHPDWHPDGSSLIAEGDCAGNIALYVIKLSDGNVSLIYDSDAVDGYPRWFPDGTRVAFHQIDAQRQARLAVLRLAEDGSATGVDVVTDGPFDIEPAPSPDGQRLAYSTAGDAGQDIAILDLPTRDVQVWPTSAAENFPSWTPAGDALIFHAAGIRGTNIYRLEISSGTRVPLSIDGNEDRLGHLDSNGARMVFSSERDGDREVYLRFFETEVETRLTNRPGRDGYPKFSPDGRQIAYHSVTGDMNGEPETVVRVLDVDSGRIRSFRCPGSE